MKKLVGLLLACLVSFSAAAQTAPVAPTKATKRLEEAVNNLDVNAVETALNHGADPRAIGVYYDFCKDMLAGLVRNFHYYRNDDVHKDQVMQIIRLLVENGADMTVHACDESALEEALHIVAKAGGYRNSRESYKNAFDVLDLMLSLTDSSKALSTVPPERIERVIAGAGFKHPELFDYLIKKGLKVQSRYVEYARKLYEDELECEPDPEYEYENESYKNVADLLQQAYEEQSPEFIKEVVKRELQVRKECPALRKQF